MTEHVGLHGNQSIVPHCNREFFHRDWNLCHMIFCFITPLSLHIMYSNRYWDNMLTLTFDNSWSPFWPWHGRLSYNRLTADCAGALFYSMMKLALETPYNSASKHSWACPSLLSSLLFLFCFPIFIFNLESTKIKFRIPIARHSFLVCTIILFVFYFCTVRWVFLLHHYG